MKKSVLITGSTSGLGEQLCIKYSSNNYRVLIHGRDRQRTDNLISKIQAENYIKIIGDIRDSEVIERLGNAARENNIETLINNAAVSNFGELESQTKKEIDIMVNTNLLATIELTRVIYSFFTEKRSGKIVNIGSMSSINPVQGGAVYCATKYGLKGFTDSLRLEAEDKGIEVIGVYPRGMNTEGYKGKRPRSHLLDPSEVANDIFEASERSLVENIFY